MFSSQTTNPEPIILIPDDTLTWCSLSVRGIQQGKESGVDYFDMELTVIDGEYSQRKIWAMITSPWDKGAKEGAAKFAITNLTRIFEMVGIFIPGNETSYKEINTNSDPHVVASRITGCDVGVKIGIQQPQKGTTYLAKNTVKEWLSPNPDSKGYPGYLALRALYPNSRSGSQKARSAGFMAHGAPNAAVPQPFVQQPAQVALAPSAPGGAPAWMQGPQQAVQPVASLRQVTTAPIDPRDAVAAQAPTYTVAQPPPAYALPDGFYNSPQAQYATPGNN